MDDVKELKRLLLLAKMKFKKENTNCHKNPAQQRVIKIKRKGLKHNRKIKSGYSKKRFVKNTVDKFLDSENLHSFPARQMREQTSSGCTNRNRVSGVFLNSDSLFNKHTSDFVLKSENFVQNPRHEHRSSIDHGKLTLLKVFKISLYAFNTCLFTVKIKNLVLELKEKDPYL